MRLFINGGDRSEDVGEQLIETARQRPDCGLSRQIAEEMDVLTLKSTGKMTAYLDRHVELLRSRNCVDTAHFDFPVSRLRAQASDAARPGVVGCVMYLIRRFFWKALRYQHDWMAFHQNSINVQLAYELEFEKAEREKQIADLEKRLNRLESVAVEKPDEQEH